MIPEGGNVSAGKVAELARIAARLGEAGVMYMSVRVQDVRALLDVVEAAQAMRAYRFPLVSRQIADDAELRLDKALAALEESK